MAGADVTVRGPLFDGSIHRAIDSFLSDAARQVATEGEADMVAATGVFRKPTGFYRSQVGFHTAGDGFVIDDGGVIYGPWLEGVSSRNRTSRFKGYRIWRQTTQRLGAKASRIAERVLSRYLGRMQ